MLLHIFYFFRVKSNSISLLVPKNLQIEWTYQKKSLAVKFSIININNGNNLKETLKCLASKCKIFKIGLLLRQKEKDNIF